MAGMGVQTPDGLRPQQRLSLGGNPGVNSPTQAGREARFVNRLVWRRVFHLFMRCGCGRSEGKIAIAGKEKARSCGRRYERSGSTHVEAIDSGVSFGSVNKNLQRHAASFDAREETDAGSCAC